MKGEMKQTPLFSIVIPVYNVAPYLRECLDSVFAQTFPDWECICVDDGSTDESNKTLDEYAAADSRFRVIHQANAGVSVARNVALDVAQGSWIWFVDGDDVIHLHALEWAAERIRDFSDIDTLCIKYAYVPNGEMVKRNEKTLETARCDLRRDRCSDTLNAHRYGPGSCIVSRTALAENRFGLFIRGEDTLFLSHIYWETKTWLLTDAEVYFYRIRPGSAMQSTPTVVCVRDFLQTKLLALNEMDVHRNLWSQKSMEQFFVVFGDFIYRKDNPLWSLPAKDRKHLLPLWLKLQNLLRSLSGQKQRWRQFVCTILSFVPSPRFAKFLVFLPPRMKRTLSRWLGRFRASLHSISLA